MATRNASKLVAVAVNPEIETIVETPTLELVPDAPAESAPSTESLAPDAPAPDAPVAELDEEAIMVAALAKLRADKAARAEEIRVAALDAAQKELVRLRTEFDASVGPLLAQIAALKGVPSRTTKSATGGGTSAARSASPGLSECAGTYTRDHDGRIRTLEISDEGICRLDGAVVTSPGAAMKLVNPAAMDSGRRFWKIA